MINISFINSEKQIMGEGQIGIELVFLSLFTKIGEDFLFWESVRVLARLLRSEIVS